ncbi:NUDIX domain-containing protein [Streptomyces sp. NPDC094468]|uniref:NUDIX domain-containing protein n=1 Tax=Streptomyces sp. NPDC094468 TaxID=3366066 RepID=UPI00381ADA79
MSDSPHQLIADVAQVLLHTNGAALCVRRALDAALAPGQLTVVGGHLEVGEPLDHAARREAMEQVRVLITAEQQEFCGLIHHHDSDDGLDRITAVFVAQSWTGEPYNAGLYLVEHEYLTNPVAPLLRSGPDALTAWNAALEQTGT